jgi:hypothetical protein
VYVSDAIRRYRKLSPVQQSAIMAITAWNFSLIIIAQRDLSRRPASEIRGSKRLWRLACLTNTVGPISYLRWGRRSA